MAQLPVRDLDNEIVRALKKKAAEEGISVEEAHRRLLRAALLAPEPKKSFKEFLLEMPEGGEDSVFERHTTEHRDVSL
jgi:antitoxin FitA